MARRKKKIKSPSHAYKKNNTAKKHDINGAKTLILKSGKRTEQNKIFMHTRSIDT